MIVQNVTSVRVQRFDGLVVLVVAGQELLQRFEVALVRQTLRLARRSPRHSSRLFLFELGPFQFPRTIPFWRVGNNTNNGFRLGHDFGTRSYGSPFSVAFFLCFEGRRGDCARSPMASLARTGTNNKHHLSISACGEEHLARHSSFGCLDRSFFQQRRSVMTKAAACGSRG